MLWGCSAASITGILCKGIFLFWYMPLNFIISTFTMWFMVSWLTMFHIVYSLHSLLSYVMFIYHLFCFESLYVYLLTLCQVRMSQSWSQSLYFLFYFGSPLSFVCLLLLPHVLLV